MLQRASYTLADRYLEDRGRVFLSGAQALARLPIAQLREDRRRGWNTAAYVTGYPGSPLAGYDREVAIAARLATEQGYELHAVPGLNEELAAAAVMGTQLAVNRPSCRFDGIVGVWYGKAPGLDRASDAIRHAMFAGTSARGGAVAIIGDDPSAKSSTLPSSSDATMIDLHMPMLYPGDVQEAIDLGHHAVAMSRASGLWTGIKVVEALADGSGTVELRTYPEPVIPVVEVDGRPWVPHPTGQLLTPTTLEVEREFREIRLDVAMRYGVDNHLNAIEVRSHDDWIGIVACGYTYRETRAALALLGLRRDDDLRAAGVRVLRLAMPVPLDQEQVRTFADGLDEIFVIEEKNPSLELLVKDALYTAASRPMVTGKLTPDGHPLIPSTGQLTADVIAPRLRDRLGTQIAADRLAPLPAAGRIRIPLHSRRVPFFCSGCPHNTSTHVPDGTLVGAGIGCHTMALFMDAERVGEIIGVSAMGTEGAPWVGMAPFVDDPHLVQNLGDGTFFHSGSLAVRNAVASGVNITFKLLYNGAVAMTGGQDAVGGMALPELVASLLAEGVKRVLVTTDDPKRVRAMRLPAGVEVWPRERVLEAQQTLAAIPGCTVLIHDQRCAAEKRRDRKRANRQVAGTARRSERRVVINERVCEGCGDCARVSNCLSVQPVDTPYGRKTMIDQHSCNLDYSCLRGDCPAFATIDIDPDHREPSRAVPDAPQPDTLAQPTHLAPATWTVRCSGIGGTGVVTISQILGSAALLDGLEVRGLDQTGLSQKAGPVVSDLRFTEHAPSFTNRATRASVDVLLAFDQLVAASDAQIDASSSARTSIVANTAHTPTATMVTHPELAFPTADVTARLGAATSQGLMVPATSLADGLLGDDAMTNVLLVGAAYQAGALPVSSAAIEEAITLNGVAVNKNLAAFRWGRAWVLDREATERAAGLNREPVDESLDALVERLHADLVGFQSTRVADGFAALVDRVRGLGDDELTAIAARNLHKLTAYKDEYEVARLLLAPEAADALAAVGGRRGQVLWHLHPPMLRALGMRRKLRLGAEARPALRLLRAMRRLRGTPFDVLGWAKMRRLERRLRDEYRAALTTVVDALATRGTAEDFARARELAGLPDQVRGYEQLKFARAEAYQRELAEALAWFTNRA